MNVRRHIRTTAIAGALALGLMAVSACSLTDGGDGREGGKLKVTASFYPMTFLAERVGGAHVTVSTLTKPGVEPHDLELTPRQTAQLGEAGWILHLKGIQPAVDKAIEQADVAHKTDAATLTASDPGAPERTGSAAGKSAAPAPATEPATPSAEPERKSAEPRKQDGHGDHPGHEDHTDHGGSGHEAHGAQGAQGESDHTDHTDHGDHGDHGGHSGQDDHGDHGDHGTGSDGATHGGTGTATDGTDGSDSTGATGGGDHDGHSHDHAGGGDPHLWLDPVKYAEMARGVGTALAKADPEHADTYRANADTLADELTELDTAFREGLRTVESKTFITTHSAFGHLAGRYGLIQEGISGISPEAEPSPARIKQLQTIAEQDGVTTVFFETLASDRTAKTLAADTGMRTAVLDPLEGITDKSPGSDYLEVMRANLAALQKALGAK
ncbi:metal ABC transporter substrate-binding protein [Streptomyces clavuligerus]|nr:metal ABC transporter substrate-binding protein [Streptomyces clavuligerus]ANW20291.1 metal ABC transporter substrate-binding protein [Streptomyces clavuligerus]WDN51818.1 metal ABC transporter substrate-binding protein [Streptomyces clavuligerus]